MFVFISADGSERSLDLKAETARIGAVAAQLRQRIDPGSVVGLLFRSEPNLIINWCAAITAGLRPLVMQYPTRKQSRAYWLDSIRHTMAVTNLSGLIADEHCAEMELSNVVTTVRQAELDNLPPASLGDVMPRDWTIIQLSSGTTGYRKATEFTAAALRRHVIDYNKALMLDSASDRIVSWLPLYHDMGYVACFVMPLLLDVDVVMMDPMDWVARPDLLLMAIARHRCTTCYMPNFGYEVMARELSTRLDSIDLGSMRHWVSCSEPVSGATATRFLQAAGIPSETFLPCYAMAENIFAISIGRGVRTKVLDGVEVVSCGQPISDVQVKTVEGEIWVRSPTSFTNYMNGEDIRDADGFYPTGDLGVLLDGELFVAGRKQDLLIQAGRKYMLSDIDITLNRLLPEVKGRAAALATYDDRLGTQKPIILIEAKDFFLRRDHDEIGRAMLEATGLEQIEIHFVPPRFLTKTSSGKINRRVSLENWLRAVRAKSRELSRGDTLSEVYKEFPNVRRDFPVSEVLDSLSLTVLRMILEGTSISVDGTLTLSEIEKKLLLLREQRPDRGGAKELRIISLADRNALERLTAWDIQTLENALNCKVILEHLCLPPSPILLSDLIFNEYFQPRVDQIDYGYIEKTLYKLRNASIILVDDAAELLIPPEQVYGVLSHDFTRDPSADLIAVRWQSYSRGNDKLPLTLVSGVELPLADRDRTISNLSAYLHTPIFRIAAHRDLGEFTSKWEFHNFSDGPQPSPSHGLINIGELISTLSAWVRDLEPSIRHFPSCSTERLITADLPHFCSSLVQKASIDVVLSEFDSFCVAGQPSSVPYIYKELSRLNKPFRRVPSYAPEIIATVDVAYSCLLICGAWGDHPIATPAAEIMPAQGVGDHPVHNMPSARCQKLVFKVPGQDRPPSGIDWFFLTPIRRDWDTAAWRASRLANKQGMLKRIAMRRQIRQAWQFFKNEDFTNAINAADKAVKMGSRDPAALHVMSSVYLSLSRLDEARQQISEAIEVDSSNAKYLELQSKILRRLGDTDAAEVSARRAQLIRDSNLTNLST